MYFLEYKNFTTFAVARPLSDVTGAFTSSHAALTRCAGLLLLLFQLYRRCAPCRGFLHWTILLKIRVNSALLSWYFKKKICWAQCSSTTLLQCRVFLWPSLGSWSSLSPSNRVVPCGVLLLNVILLNVLGFAASHFCSTLLSSPPIA